MSDDIKELYKVILKLETIEECEMFFEDLFTRKEIDNFAHRLKSAELLLQDYTYDEVLKKVNISSATLSRVSKSVQYGQGYKRILNK